MSPHDGRSRLAEARKAKAHGTGVKPGWGPAQSLKKTLSDTPRRAHGDTAPSRPRNIAKIELGGSAAPKQLHYGWKRLSRDKRAGSRRTFRSFRYYSDDASQSRGRFLIVRMPPKELCGKLLMLDKCCGGAIARLNALCEHSSALGNAPPAHRLTPNLGLRALGGKYPARRGLFTCGPDRQLPLAFLAVSECP